MAAALPLLVGLIGFGNDGWARIGAETRKLSRSATVTVFVPSVAV